MRTYEVGLVSRLFLNIEDVKEYVVNSKELANHINSMANVECHEVAPTAELKRLAEIIGEALRKKRGGER